MYAYTQTHIYTHTERLAIPAGLAKLSHSLVGGVEVFYEESSHVSDRVFFPEKGGLFDFAPLCHPSWQSPVLA